MTLVLLTLIVLLLLVNISLLTYDKLGANDAVGRGSFAQDH